MENQENNRKWYKKKRYLVSLMIFGIAIVASLSQNSDNKQQNYRPTPQVQGIIKTNTEPSNTLDTQQVKIQTVAPKVVEQPTLSNDNYYQNSTGNIVHSPAYSSNNSVPAGASAKCGDGTYSFSQSRRGTCSHHGGVVEWY